VSEDIIKALEEQIQRETLALKAKQLMLKEMTRKPAVPFAETKFGRGYMKFVANVTSPFVKAHRDALDALANPKLHRAKEFLLKAEKTLEYCNKVYDKNDKQAKYAAVRAADMRIALEQFEEVTEVSETVKNLQVQLHEQFTRLRNTEVSEEAKEILGHFKNMMTVQENA
jgi:hypothetical protein